MRQQKMAGPAGTAIRHISRVRVARQERGLRLYPETELLVNAEQRQYHTDNQHE